MTAPIVTFFNNNGGVGTTELVYHIAWMLADRGHRVVSADLDPQAHLTAAFLTEDEIDELWSGSGYTIWGAIRPWVEGTGEILPATLAPTAKDRLVLLPGDLGLSSFEDELSESWPKSLHRNARSTLVTSTFWTVLRNAAERYRADVVLMDVGPSLGAINRSALIASDYVVVPVAADLFSLKGLENLGPAIREWRGGWGRRLEKHKDSPFALPEGKMQVLGYVVVGQGVKLNRPVQSYERWISRIPVEFHQSVVQDTDDPAPFMPDDPYCLAQLKHYHSLLPLAQEARKPVFALRPADGAFGGHLLAARRAYEDFRYLAEQVLASIQ